MLKNLLNNKEFSKTIKEFLKKPEILDIIIFGSTVKGKETPHDIDLLVVYTKEIDLHGIRKELKKMATNIEITGKMYNELFKPEFFARESILSEGFSLRQKKPISGCFGYKSLILFKYSLKGMNKSRRMQFYYSLHGRGTEGIIKKNKCYKFAESIILAPVENSEIIKSFFEKWKIEVKEFPIILPEKIVKYSL